MRWLDNITNSMDMNLRKLWDSERQGSLSCCSPRGCRELDMFRDGRTTNKVINGIFQRFTAKMFAIYMETGQVKLLQTHCIY